jgi:toxin ParE1/3/4
MKIRYSEEADQQLRELRRFIARESGYPQRAKNYVKRILSFCRKLENFPQRGTRRDDIVPDLRMIGFEGRVTIVFYVMEHEVLYSTAGRM